MPRERRTKKPKEAKNYDYQGSEHPLRPDIGTEKDFQKKKPPATYRYDSSLSPELNWDDNPAREQAEALIAEILEAEDIETAKTAARKLKAMSQPFLNWTGKAEKLSFEVPTLPLFVHERLSTRAIIETLKSHKVGGDQLSLFDLFSDPKWSITDQILKAYEFQGDWVNRMILGDSLVVMNSLIQYEGLAGQVQMIYLDPPYGVKFGSNFQPFVKKLEVKPNDDDSLTREPEMVQAYRDTWELGLHSYLTYLRDRLLLARELLTESGSVFVQISDENVHHVRELMDEIFREENFVAIIPFRKKTMPLGTNYLEQMSDFILWYGKKVYDESRKPQTKYNKLYLDRSVEGEFHHCWYELSDGTRHKMSIHQLYNHSLLPSGARVYRLKSLEPSGVMPSGKYDYEFEGKLYKHPKNGWATPPDGMKRLEEAKRLQPEGNRLTYIIYADESSATQLTTPWTDTVGANNKAYVVQTNTKVIERCLLMTTDPSDLVFDGTCGSGTTAYVAEQWGRRWITCDVSRVPLALARQRLLTATFPYYELRDETMGPGGGFVYKRKQNKKGEEFGGIVPHITLGSIANDEPPDQEILVDRPEELSNFVRVSGPFVIEGTIPPPVDMEEQKEPQTEAVEVDSTASFTDRMLEILRKSPVLRLPGNKTVTLTGVRQPTRSQNLSAEAMVKASDLDGASLTEVVEEALEENDSRLPLSQKPVAFVFGPENGAVAERTVYEAAGEAHSRRYAHLFVIGFAISANARQFIENCHETMDIPATYIQATPDLLMGDLLKNMRSSQIFSVCGLPEVKVHNTDDGRYQVELLGLDVFDPITMEVEHEQGKNVPAWFLDTDYNGLCFYVRQAFFPRTSAWEGIKKALKGTYEESVWEHLAGTISAPFEVGEHRGVAVKVIDDRGNELLVVKKID